MSTSEALHCSLFCFFSSRRRHTRFDCDWSSDVCSSDLDREVGREVGRQLHRDPARELVAVALGQERRHRRGRRGPLVVQIADRKSTRLNSSHSQISYAVFCLKKKKKNTTVTTTTTNKL